MISIRKQIPVRRLGSIAAVATVVGLTLGLSMATAQAAPTATTAAVQKAGAGDRTLVAPPAPSAATRAALALVPASSPTTSPAVSSIHIAASQAYTCSSGNLCPVVWDPTTSNYEVFFLYNCNRYSVSFWNGTGNYTNRQTGGVTSYFYGQSGNVLTSFSANVTNVSYNWTPVWSIRNC